MKLENNETVADIVQVNKEIEAFYHSLYTLLVLNFSKKRSAYFAGLYFCDLGAKLFS